MGNDDRQAKRAVKIAKLKGTYCQAKRTNDFQAKRINDFQAKMIGFMVVRPKKSIVSNLSEHTLTVMLFAVNVINCGMTDQ